ncbi:benzoate membrane transport protein [Nocardioides luteus]|uniref:Benzoate transporter n=1 Tax=Nocardioides luteus TaxID=1844 RepID=A0ABQ5T3F9_9ACTN|nr:benzoate/H(+) symporter BenE family transporter [Nocardioides luteus]MDR7310174.1 benzoate membrane transport protein [Nocardioides luteus]GGR69308.1 benzoate transporter [Nocardioides luteus]GLJ70358.1 benzoate transporter [Nocardioides luteus]
MTSPTTGSAGQPTSPRIRDDRSLIESGPGFRSGLHDLRRHIAVAPVSAGVVAAIFGCTGPALIIIDGAGEAGLSDELTTSWIFGIYVFGGLISLVLGLYYKMPITGAWSIPGAVLVVGALSDFEFSEMVGAFFAAGVLVLVLGLTGLLRRLAGWLPVPIVMAMIAGALIRFGTGVVDAGVSTPVIVVAAAAGYLLLTRFVRSVPGVVGALVFGTIASLATGAFGSASADVRLSVPQLVAPSFDLTAILAVAVPLAVLVVGAENAQATGVLMTEKYRPPVNAMTLISGVGGILTSLFGGHNANIAGPMTAICAAEQAGEEKDGRYVATVVNGVLFILFGVFAGVAVAVVSTLPPTLVAAVAGLAMIGVLVSAFREAFGGTAFQTGAFAALVIAMSGVTILNISAPLWALLGGVLVSLVVESKDFRAGTDQA